MIMAYKIQQSNKPSEFNSGLQPVLYATLAASLIGDIMKKIPLTQGKFAIVDDNDFEELSKYKWHANKMGNSYYAKTSFGKNGTKRIRPSMHGLILKLKKPQEIDHINRDGLDNRKCNLRVCTRSQNQQNKRPQKQCTSKYKGVSWYEAGKKWRAFIMLKSKHYYLGGFNNEIECAKAYDKRAKELFGEFARTNF